MKSFEYIYDYYPESDSIVSEEQKMVRQMVRDFMYGDATAELLSEIITRVKDLVMLDGIDLICFAPAPTGTETILRFGELVESLCHEIDCDVFLDAITLLFDSDPITLKRHYQCNKERVKGKKVLVIGDVSTTGEAIRKIDEVLSRNGAKEVYVLFVAKTVVVD